jgi:hypothetical protein
MWIRNKHPETKKRLHFYNATLQGKCCWKLWDSYVGGTSYPMSAAGTFSPGWKIAAVEYVEDCEFK